MECNKDEAMRAKDIALKKLAQKDTVGAKKFALKAQNLYPQLEGLPQLVATLDVYISAEKKINGEIDWYGVLGVDPFADDDTIRKNYRKLALTLHPDKNKLIGADGAFKILSEAWTLLSDKSKRSAYDQKRNIRAVNPSLPTRNVPMPAGKNGLHNFTSGINLNATNRRTAAFSKPAPIVRHPPKSNTFWTACDRCKMQYEYRIDYLNHTLLCPNCHEPFLAVQTTPPPLDGRKSSTPWSAQQQDISSDGRQLNPAAVSNTRRARIPGFGSSNHADSQVDSVLKSYGNGSSRASAFSAAQVKQVAQPHFNKFKRGREEGQAPGSNSVPVEEWRMKSRSTDENAMQAAKRGMTSQAFMRNGACMESVSAYQNRISEAARFSVAGGNKISITRDLSQLEIRHLLMFKARVEIRKKLNEWSITAAKKTSGKNERQKGKERQEPTVISAKDVACKRDLLFPTANKFEEKDLSSPDSDVDSDPNGPEIAAMNVPDPDFHDFDQDRTEKSFGENQIWAAYDDDDGMPRFYAMIHGVVSKRPFKMRISWLNSKSNNELAPINWIGSGFSKTCGDFRIGKHEFNNSLNSFSQKVKWVKGPRGVINIYPGKGEAWALYRNWSHDWNELTPDEVIHKYDMVEVLEDYREERGVTITPLVKVAGFRTVFRQHSDPTQIRIIPREELFRFSHQVPSYLLTGQEAQNAPRGCRELDPAAVPLELLQVISEDKEEGVVENDLKLNHNPLTGVVETTNEC